MGISGQDRGMGRGMARPRGGRPLTGRKVLAITVSAFAVIVAVNVTMAVKAVRTFPGLEVANSYVASQGFDAERAAQEALGWTAEVRQEGGGITVLMRDRDGLPAPLVALEGSLGRTTHTREDRALDFRRSGGLFHAAVPLAPGNWLVHLLARAPDGTAFRQRFTLHVRG